MVGVQVAMVEHEVKHTIAKLSEWMAPETVPTPAWLAPATSEVRRDPYGVVLIIAPFNYPLQVRVEVEHPSQLSTPHLTAFAAAAAACTLLTWMMAVFVCVVRGPWTVGRVSGGERARGRQRGGPEAVGADAERVEAADQAAARLPRPTRHPHHGGRHPGDHGYGTRSLM